MSLPKPKIPPPTAAAPAQPNLDPARRELGGGDEKAAAVVKRKKGRSGLRIDLQNGGMGGGTGANVPL